MTTNQPANQTIRQLITDICFENGGVTKPMVDKLETAITAHFIACLPDETILTTKYGYNSREKKYGFRIAVEEIKSNWKGEADE